MSGAKTVTVCVPRDMVALGLGANQVARAIFNGAEQSGLDVQVVRTGTRGLLWLEPMVEVDTPAGRVAYGPVSADDVTGLLAAGFLEGREHPLRLGDPEQIPYLARQNRLTFHRCGVIDPLSVEDYRTHGGYRGLEAALSVGPEKTVEQVKDSGLRGRGGAGFPAGIKWNTVMQAQAEQKYVICNADEGDSGTFADRIMMEGDPFNLIEGMTIAAVSVGATRGYIYCRSEYPQAFRTLREAIANGVKAGVLGDDILGSGKSFHLEVRLGAGAYVCGEETSLLESLEGKRGIVRAKPPIPALKGFLGKPTLVNNVMTFTAVPWILEHGAKAYADYGMGRSLGTLPIQLAGNVKYGGLIEYAFGITIRDVVEGFGGGTLSGRPARAVQIGGPLGAYFPESLFDTPLDYEKMAAAGGLLGHGGIVVFDDSVDMAKQARFAFEFCVAESCGKCTPCRIGATRGVETMDKVIAGVRPEFNLKLVEDLCEIMFDGSLCAMGGLTPMPVRSAIRNFPEDFRRHGQLPAAAE